VQNHPHEYGYARVSTDGQSIDDQVRQLRAAGARQVFREVASGARPIAPSSAVCSPSSMPALLARQNLRDYEAARTSPALVSPDLVLEAQSGPIISMLIRQVSTE
jgi:hypothetical protein